MTTEIMPNLLYSAVCNVGKQFQKIVALVSTAPQCITSLVSMYKNDSKVMSIAQVGQLGCKIHIT